MIAANHANSNDKVVAKLKVTPDGEGSVDGKTEDGTPVILHKYFYKGKLDSPLEPGDYILKVFARDTKGERCGFAAAKFAVKK